MNTDKETIELGKEFIPQWNTDNLIPVVTIEESTGTLLMLAYTNKEALELTLKTKEAHYFSRSSNQIWHKGATSGQIQKIKRVSIDCDQDTILYLVNATAINCHRGYQSCFYRNLNYNDNQITLNNN